MENLLAQIRDLSRTVTDAPARKKLVTDLRDLSIALEDGDDTLQRLSNAPLHLYGAWIGSTLNIFEILSVTDHSSSLNSLAQKTQADPILLGRLLRYMASIKLIEESSADEFKSNDVTRTLATPRGQNYLDLYYNTVSPIFFELPKFLERTRFQNPSDESKTAFQDAFNYEGPIYSWWAANPDRAAVFNKHMEYRREDGRNWLDVFPVEKYVKAQHPEEVIFVDVGGNLGHQCVRLKEVHPDLVGRVILQDLQYAIENAPDNPGVEKMVHDFFQPQPVKGAYIYYFRGVLHCFNDEKCKQILDNTSAAMSSESIILIDDAMFPSTSVFWQATQMDMLMLSSLASMERTRPQWQKLLGSAGLKIAETYVYSPILHENVIVAVRA